jgi:hypothetical protein
MQEVDLTPKLLLDFSLDFIKVPNVTINGGEGVPFHCHILAAWFQELTSADSSNYFAMFQSYLCGRGQFVMPELSKDEFVKLLATTVQNEMTGGRYGS